MPLNRRRLLTHGASVVAGAGVALGGGAGAMAIRAQFPLPFYGGYASAVHADRVTPPRSSAVEVFWGGDAGRKRIALTFDDGPRPQWTPRVLDILEETGTKATFFMLGVNAWDHGGLVKDRLDGHEIGNHSWDHPDLARMDYQECRNELSRAHDALTALWGREPVLMRPPYGHLGGSTLLAANELGYRVVLWNRQMIESEYVSNPPGLVDYIVGSCQPGTILLAHDTGAKDRLVAIDGLAAMITGLREKGFEFVTVSELLSTSPTTR